MGEALLSLSVSSSLFLVAEISDKIIPEFTTCSGEEDLFTALIKIGVQLINLILTNVNLLNLPVADAMRGPKSSV